MKDALTFSYDDDDEEVLGNVPELIKYSGLAIQGLTEVYVDPGYELEEITPLQRKYLDKLRERFQSRKYEPIPFYDMRSALSSIGKEMNKKLSRFHIIQTLRVFWRAGYFRRFIRGKTSRTNKVGRGEWYGVHYMIYPKEEYESNDT